MVWRCLLGSVFLIGEGFDHLLTPCELLFEIFDGFVDMVSEADCSDDEGFEEMTEEELKRKALKKQMKDHKKLMKADLPPLHKDNAAKNQFPDCPKNRACRKLNAKSAFKAQNKIQVKCHPKQPMVRGRN